MGEHLIIDEDPLAGEDAAEVAVLQNPALHDQVPAGKILENDEILVAIGQDALGLAQPGKQNIAAVRRAKAHHFERRGSLVIDADVVLVVGVELINDVDRLGGHAELRHETNSTQ